MIKNIKCQDCGTVIGKYDTKTKETLEQYVNYNTCDKCGKEICIDCSKNFRELNGCENCILEEVVKDIQQTRVLTLEEILKKYKIKDYKRLVSLLYDIANLTDIEIEDTVKVLDEIDSEYEDQHKVKLTNKKCNRCGCQVAKSKVKGYTYQCLNCDEDLYTFEVSKLKKGDVKYE